MSAICSVRIPRLDVVRQYTIASSIFIAQRYGFLQECLKKPYIRTAATATKLNKEKQYGDSKLIDCKDTILGHGNTEMRVGLIAIVLHLEHDMHIIDLLNIDDEYIAVLIK